MHACDHGADVFSGEVQNTLDACVAVVRGMHLSAAAALRARCGTRPETSCEDDIYIGTPRTYDLSVPTASGQNVEPRAKERADSVAPFVCPLSVPA